MSIATETSNPERLGIERRALRAELTRLQRRLRLQLALETLVDVAIGVASLGALLVALDWWLRIGLAARLALLAIGLVALLTPLIVRASQRWRAAGVDELSLAVLLDRHRPGTGQRVADVLQLPELLEGDGSASPAMVRLAVRRAADALAESDWRMLWNRRRTALAGLALLAGLAAPAIFGFAAPEAARLSLARWLLGSNERWPQRTYLSVVGVDDRGRLIAPRDEPFLVEVRADLPGLRRRGDRWLLPGRGTPLLLRHRSAATEVPESVTVTERASDGKTRDGSMIAADASRFRYEFPPSDDSTTFELTGGDDWLGPLTIDRVDRPSLAEVGLRVKEPGADDFRTIEDPRQHLLFLPDTEVELSLVGSEPLAEASLNAGAGDAPSLSRAGARTFNARWTLREAATLEVMLTSDRTGLTSRPSFLSIGLQKDREPRVSLRALGIGAHVTPVATVPMTIGATDDLGLAALRLAIERIPPRKSDEDEPDGDATPSVATSKSTIDLPLPLGDDRDVLDHQARHDLALQADPMVAGTILRIVAEAEDDCARGAQVGRSAVLALQVVSADDLFYEILIRQRAERSRFMAALETAEAQAPALEGSPTPESAVGVMRAQHSVTRQVEQIAERLDDALQEMKLNQIGTPKSHRLMQEAIIDPMRALAAGPMNELRGTLQALASDGRDPESVRTLHNEVVAEMQAILDQMSQWESFVDVVNQVAEVIRMEQGVLRAAEEARETRTEGVFDALP